MHAGESWHGISNSVIILNECANLSHAALLLLLLQLALRPARRQEVAQLRLVAPRRLVRRRRRRQRVGRAGRRCGHQLIGFGEVRGRQAGVQVADLEVHGALAEQIATLLLHQLAVRADDEIGLGVLVHQTRAGLQPLPFGVLLLVAVGDHAGSARLENCVR